MKLHLVAGFLGSGKTTAIARAGRILSERGLRTGIVTNDQGDSLVDSEYFRSMNMPYGEVTGGCFCCNYHQLDREIDQLRDVKKADTLFAESVGSCTDLVATVLKPLLHYKSEHIDRLTFSTFVDAHLLHNYLTNGILPFHEDTNYIWKKQIEEAEILVLNKTDQLGRSVLLQLEDLTRRAFPDKMALMQNSLSDESVTRWIDLLQNVVSNGIRRSIDIDYDKYGAGEANLAWLDQTVEFHSSDGSASYVSGEFIYSFIQSLDQRGMPVGHLKFMVYNGAHAYKVSYTATAQRPDIPATTQSNDVRVVVNARIQSSPGMLRRIVASLLNDLRVHFGIRITESNVSFFKPGFPTPTHRMA